MVAVISSTAIYKSNAQFLDVKPWKGTYPEMDEQYPLSFISFKGGFLVPTPHYFIRLYPTHYYLKVGALPVSDATGYSGIAKAGFLRIAERLIEQNQMKQRHEETDQIKFNRELSKQIEQKLFDSRKESLADIYKLTEKFVGLYKKFDRLSILENGEKVKNILQDEADQLLMRFLMVNLLETSHGKKLNAFSEIGDELTSLLGETDYSYQKLFHYSFYKGSPVNTSYAFLTR